MPPASVHDNCGDAVAKPSIKTVGMVVKRDRREALAIAKLLAGWLRAEGRTALAEAGVAKRIGADAVSSDELVSRAGLIVVAGGDGAQPLGGLGLATLVALGIGVNVNQRAEELPTDTPKPPTSLLVELGREGRELARSRVRPVPGAPAAGGPPRSGGPAWRSR